MGNRGAVEDGNVLHQADYDRATDSTVCQAVIDALSEIEGEDVEDVANPLHDSIDLDALDRLFGPRFDGAPRSTEGHVEFNVRGRRVVVGSDGEILICQDDTIGDLSF